MTRRALIILNPGEGKNVCAGVLKDGENYRRFLTSPYGGLWYGSEIEILQKPTKIGVLLAVQKLKHYDYGFVVFSGHGAHSRSQGATELELSPGEVLSSAHLLEGSPRQTVILDCCRVVATEMILEAAMFKAALAGLSLHSDQCRTQFDRAVERCPSGIVVAHACAIGETAGDDSQRGGYYSAALINATEDWAKNLRIDTERNYAVLSIAEAHSYALPSVRRSSGGRQNPQIERPKSDPVFPFGIVA